MSGPTKTQRVITVHCFFAPCKYTVKGADVRTNHGVMEEHYQQRHGKEIERLLGTSA